MGSAAFGESMERDRRGGVKSLDRNVQTGFFPSYFLLCSITALYVLISYRFLCSSNIFRSLVQSKLPCYQRQPGLSQGLVQVWVSLILASSGKPLNAAVSSVFRMMELQSSGRRIQRCDGSSPRKRKRPGVRTV